MTTSYTFNPFTGNLDAVTPDSVAKYTNFAAFPVSGSNGDLALALDTDFLYSYSTTSVAWVIIGGPATILSVGPIDSQTANTNGAVIAADALVLQSASTTKPGLVNNTTQSFSGNKTFTGTVSASNLSGTNTGDQTSVSGNAGSATTVATTSTATNANFFPLFVSSSSNSNQAADLGTGLTFNPSTNNLSTTTFTGALVGNASSATTSTTTTTATNATNVATTQTSTNANFFPLFVSSSTNSNQPVDLGTGLTFNPSTNNLATTTFTGALSGNATTATTATNATNVATTATNSTNASFFPTFVGSSSSSNQGVDTATGLSFNPSTNTLTTTTFSGALTGAASGNLAKATGDIDLTSFAGANNQSASTNVTGLAFANGSVRSFRALVSTYVNATTSLYQEFTLDAVQRGSDWAMSIESTGDDSLVTLSITTAGQVQYTSANYSGFTSLAFRFRALVTSV